ncbi:MULTISPECIES: quaternary amine ABC transporter ATP-binding protein [Agrobacterium tumefaciens complex]|jgi:glycine betaine/proline transport system ATP-binding protein|uniref:Quaternary amine transport ATP-binding protein n=1 Tax=Agrobacterium genomosp. 13 str. CFBP 6927 TaxID=1183428 RepID=A0ABM9VJG9_9HYPH|nr:MULTISPECIES: betaine/proline/choline family ABC transporter ATP-binding protein [Agrobacterium tumefaciens complex]TQN61364.1 betaine/proline/choline family ABC transporter ATP-binding protein [Agrobacterium tumefaciens]UXS34640.1 betaine/proline/choline family ABC transporter ATP-binding protein [Agrobacterium tumefaciens]CDN95925.1 ABC transporter, nucleotide binding/ATPase protein (Proline/glycine betaine) [Agrobacterium tumefaciens]CUX49450.1 K02000 glycine betaine/proline transport sys
MVTSISIRNVYKIFGHNSRAALELAKSGVSKQEILARSGCSLGLNNVSMDIPAGGIFVIMGLSGSGKSTLVRHLNRLIEPTAGEIVFAGNNILSLKARELRKFRTHKVSMVFQSFALAPHRTVLQNVIYGQRVRGTPRKKAEELGMQWIETVGLSGYENKYPHELSGGMKQRVGLARALTADTDVILMDEAFSALDPLIRADMQDQLLQLQQDLSKTIVFITHDLDEALYIGSQIAILKDGELVQQGTPNEILENPANEYVARFVQGRNRAHG